MSHEPRNIFHSLLVETPDDSIWTWLLVWAIRIATILLILRNYIAPYILKHLSGRIHVRSISLRSIRGIYVRQGARTWRVDRIGVSYRGASGEGSSRLTVKIEGLKLEIDAKDKALPAPSPSSKRRLTLSDLSPSPLAYRLWLILYGIYSILEPYLRPIIRSVAVACIHLIIRILPALTHALHFDLVQAEVCLAGCPTAKLRIKEATLHTQLNFTQIEDVNLSGDDVIPAPSVQRTRLIDMATIKSRLSKSFGRTWERAWGGTSGAALIELRVNEVIGVVPIMSNDGAHKMGTFLSLPDAIDFQGSLRWSPSRGIIDAHSVKGKFAVGSVHLCLNSLLSMSALHRDHSSNLRNAPFHERPSDSAKPLSPTSPMSPSNNPLQSPYNRLKSSSSRPAKLKDERTLSWLSLLNNLEFNCDTVTSDIQSALKYHYRLTVKEVIFRAGLSYASSNDLHLKYVGRDLPSDDPFGAEAYSSSLAIRTVTVDRDQENLRGRLAVMSVGRLAADALISQWPTSLLAATPFLSGDPNGPLLALRFVLKSVEITEQLHIAIQTIASLDRQTDSSSSTAHLPSALAPVPRLVFITELGSLCARLTGVHAAAIEARTDGIALIAKTYFAYRSYGAWCADPANLFSERLPIQMSVDLNFNAKPSFVRVCVDVPSEKHRFSKLGTAESEYLGDSIISIEAVQIHGTGSALGDVHDDMEAVVCIDTNSAFLDLHCSTDMMFIELWHPNVIVSLTTVLSAIPQISSPTLKRTRMIDRLPTGISATLAMGRFVLLLTGVDLNPQEDEDITRGVAFRTGCSFHYCALGPTHVQSFRMLTQRSQTRHKLYLPEERIVEAVAAAKSASFTHHFHAFSRVSFWETALRSAAATQFVADDPYIAERDDPALLPRQFLHIRSASLDISLGGHTSDEGKDNCQMNLRIPYLRGTFELAHVYSLLLALQRARTLMELRVLQTKPASALPRNKISLQVKVTIKAAQFLWRLPHDELATRIDSIACQYLPTSQISAGWRSLIIWVPVQAGTNRWDWNTDAHWKELGRFQKWNVTIPPPSHSASIFIDGDSVRIRIPFGFVLARLILNCALTIKCGRHIVDMVAANNFFEMPIPYTEGPKSVPNLTVQIGCVCLEAADDPFEANLSSIWRAGAAACRQRLDREDAFRAKVAAILAAETRASQAGHEADTDYQFSGSHSVSVEEAYARLSMVHAVDWVQRIKEEKAQSSKKERILRQRFHARTAMKSTVEIPNIVEVEAMTDAPPLFRAVLDHLLLKASGPSFRSGELVDFLHERGQGLPRDTKFTLLLPMHLTLSLQSLRVTLRDYPVPLLDIQENIVKGVAALEFDSDLVVAEEIGTPNSVDWIECPVVRVGDIPGARPMIIRVPKTMMPVKSYASPIIHVAAHGVTSFGWGTSYNGATQDLTRVVETLSTPPKDSSPNLGFWDKMRLIFHWKLKLVFSNEVRLLLKGTRDPYCVTHAGAGFALCWHGRPTLTIGYDNPDHELIQMISDSMLIVIPTLGQAEGQTVSSEGASRRVDPSSKGHRDYQKVCAKFSSGVRFGAGFVPERACGPECTKCSGTPFERKCRLFDFRPHFDIKLENKGSIAPEAKVSFQACFCTAPDTESKPVAKSVEDSYNGFRSDFIHLSVSLTSSLRPAKLAERHSSSSFHLTPRSFHHFWAWWALFDGVMSLPIRQGSYYPLRIISPKFGRHIATIKYRVSVAHIFITHAYIDESRESWVDGVTPFVGVKSMIDKFQADMHQRDQESIVPGRIPGSVKVVRHKPFYSAEVVLDGVDLRAMMAVFEEPLKRSVDVTSSGHRSNYRTRTDLPNIEPFDFWYDLDDFVETDWAPSSTPTVHLMPALACSRLTYFKRNLTSSESHIVTSKFGIEKTHSCLLGKESSVPKVQIRLASDRISELKRDIFDLRRQPDEQVAQDLRALEKKIALLTEYISHMQKTEELSPTNTSRGQTYHMPSDTVSPDEWSEFDNVYQIHCPRIFLNNAIRDILMQYYYSSREWRGFEYHMATRAVKYLQDQAKAAFVPTRSEVDKPKVTSGGAAQAAAIALRKILTGEPTSNTVIHSSEDNPSIDHEQVDPMSGWSEGVSLRKSHFCLLLKPQVVLRSETSADSICVLAAVQAKLQSFGIMDDFNVEDPISGKIMTRSYMSLNGLQTFSPANPNYSGDGCVPLEILIDYRCESDDFDRLVPQTDATFHYDKFNRLRSLRNNATAITRTTPSESVVLQDSHLHNETDLVQVHIPRFTVSASDHHFQYISNIVTGLILFSDAAHKTHLERLETMVFAYDFTDLSSAANVVADLQRRIRGAAEIRHEAEARFNATGYDGSTEILQLKAHVFLLAEELNLLFDAIKLAQDRTDDETDQKSALLLNASASEISWRMLDDRRDLLAKLAMRNIEYSWLSRQDSSTVNKLAIGDLQAFDGSPHAVWPEILSKHYEPANHPLLKRELFLLSDWTVLAPVGGITIYETFELSLHPMRLQVDAKVGSRIMEYVWPARKNRSLAIQNRNFSEISLSKDAGQVAVSRPRTSSRQSLDSPQPLDRTRLSIETNGLKPPPLRKLGVSRSFTDLRSHSTSDFAIPPARPGTPHKSRTIDAFRSNSSTHLETQARRKNEVAKQTVNNRKVGDAAEMKTRSSQKTFILVKISSLNLLLSIVKEESFDLRDARIRTRDLEYRNQTWSFEELVDQFIPTDMTWRGWVKMAFHQPLVPVLPVARELFSKTKLIASKGAAHIDAQTPSKAPKLLQKKTSKTGNATESLGNHPRSTTRSRLQKKSNQNGNSSTAHLTPAPLTAEPEVMSSDLGFQSDDERQSRPLKSRSRMLSMFHSSNDSLSRNRSPSNTLTEAAARSPRSHSGTVHIPQASLERSQDSLDNQ